jgi:MarR family transcriptional regulator, organic hydroperoxide resistance regulator
VTIRPVLDKQIHPPGGTTGRDSRFDRKACLRESLELLNQIIQAIDLFSRGALRDFGVTGPQIWALRTVGKAGVVSMGDLAQHMHLHMSTVTGIIDRLEAARLVTRGRSASDARVMELRLTSRGRSLLAKAPEPPRSKIARRLGKVAPAELRQVRSVLRLLARSMS